MKPPLKQQEQKLRDMLKLYCDDKDITKLPEGWLIRPKKDLPPVMLVVMTRKLERWAQSTL